MSESLGGLQTTNRTAYRYLLVRFLTNAPISAATVEQTVHRSIDQLFGKFGSAEMKVRLIGFDEPSDKAVFRCGLRYVERLRAALALVSRVDGEPAAAMVLRCSGTIKALNVRIPSRPR